MQKHVLQTESEFDKEKALMNQKIEHLESSLDASKKRESESSAELKA